jgi:surface polysaccharide O-acyltransferase-like enzyme
MPAHPFRRYHSLDAVRATMMLLGLVIHSATSYTATSLGAAWPYQDPRTSTVFDILAFFIHLFRMPVFFVVAGFFAALLYYRDGAARFAANRSQRVLLPLAIFWIPVYPLVEAGFIFANGRATGTIDWTPVTSGSFLQPPTLIHLWFLWDLAIFYAAAILLVPLAGRTSDSWRQAVDRWFGRIATSVWGALALAVVTTLTLLPMEIAGLETSTAFLPPLRVLIAYGVFFTFGWLLFRRRDIIEPFGAGWKTPMAAGVLSSALYLIVTVGRLITDPHVFHLVGVALAGLSMWLLIFGILGAFVSLLDRPHPVIRYLSDAAYWMYLVHLPITIWMPGLLAQTDLSAIVKSPIVLATTALVTILTYHLLVRSTAIGALLNGRRYPRSLPRPEPVAQPAGV